MDPKPGTKLKYKSDKNPVAKKLSGRPKKVDAPAKEKIEIVIRKKRRSRPPLDDTKLLSTRSGLRSLFRKGGSKYGNMRVSKLAIDKIYSERSVNMSNSDILHVIDIASFSAFKNNRKTILESDVEIGLLSIKLCSN